MMFDVICWICQKPLNSDEYSSCNSCNKLIESIFIEFPCIENEIEDERITIQDLRQCMHCQ
jgi:hypothetical protein